MMTWRGAISGGDGSGAGAGDSAADALTQTSAKALSRKSSFFMIRRFASMPNDTWR